MTFSVASVGDLNSVSHNEWCDAADEYFAANTNMTNAGRFETGDDTTSSYNQTKPLKSGIELMAGVPSIVYGYFGLVLLVPLIRQLFGGTGSSMLAACILLGIMILPTIIGVTESAVRSVPESYYEGSLALGATKERSIFFVMLPAAKSGILAGVVLGIGRAIGETMAVIMVAGNQPRMPKGLLQGVRTMTANIVTEMGYASGLHREALIATGVVLFVFILIINLSLSLLNRRAEYAN